MHYVIYVSFNVHSPIPNTVDANNIALGIIARSVPQMNVFLVGFPIKIGVGLFLLVFVVPSYIRVIAQLFSESGDMLSYLWEFISSLKG